MKKAVLALVAAVAITSAHAMSIRELRTLGAASNEGETYVLYYLVGVLEGLREAGAIAARAGQPKPFCVDERKFVPAMAAVLYQDELRRGADAYEADMPVQLVLAAALRRAHACASQ